MGSLWVESPSSVACKKKKTEAERRETDTQMLSRGAKTRGGEGGGTAGEAVERNANPPLQ